MAKSSVEKGEKMANNKGVSGKTHTRQQLNNYANQNNSNNQTFRANKQNMAVMGFRKHKKKYDIGILDGESYGWCDD